MKTTPLLAVLAMLVAPACDAEHEPDVTVAERVAELEPVVTRPGTLRFVGPTVEDPRAAEGLLERATDPHASIDERIAAYEALPRTGADFGADAVRRLAVEVDPGVRKVLISILARAEPGAAAEGLRIGLRDTEATVRAAAAHTAAWNPAGATLGAELVAALGDANAEVRAGAARSLGVLQIQAFDAVAVLLADHDPEVRLQAVHAVERIDPVRSATLPAMVQLADDSDARVARAAATLAR